MMRGLDKEGHFGMRLESCLVVQREKVSVKCQRINLRVTDCLQTKHQFNGNIWLSFERLTCVPIQTKMVKVSMLSREEKEWLKVCLLSLTTITRLTCMTTGT